MRGSSLVNMYEEGLLGPHVCFTWMLGFEGGE